MFAGNPMGAAHWSPVAQSTRGVSRRIHLLAAVADVGGAGRLSASVAETAGPDGPARSAGLGRSFSGRHLRHREKGGSGVGKTRRGKGTKCMVVVAGRGVPVGAQLASAQISEHQLAESTLATVNVLRTDPGRPRSRLRRVITDRGYDSDPLRERLKQRGTDLIVPTAATSDNDAMKMHANSDATNAAGKSNAPTLGCRTSAASRSATTASLPSFKASSTSPAPHHLEAFMQLALVILR
ncbi:DDE family transposase [Acidipila rosea]|uniref:DDE family transposase n=2 Tax=Acidipila rosea TaxID=768535 RepID=A0A4R1LE65_9BACT|nr:DDE family transposase [Acidipila rosea]